MQVSIVKANNRLHLSARRTVLKTLRKLIRQYIRCRRQDRIRIAGSEQIKSRLQRVARLHEDLISLGEVVVNDHRALGGTRVGAWLSGCCVCSISIYYILRGCIGAYLDRWDRLGHLDHWDR